ncbi:MAG TPA: hypothetical protein VD837_17680 [Terriglobales bacterium]|nr:hypothetical protein [Terriglobales bacterium]
MNFDEDPSEAIKIAAPIMRATAAQNLNTPDPIFHYQLCLQPGETITAEQFQHCVRHSLKGLSYRYVQIQGR